MSLRDGGLVPCSSLLIFVKCQPASLARSRAVSPASRRISRRREPRARRASCGWPGICAQAAWPPGSGVGSLTAAKGIVADLRQVEHQFFRYPDDGLADWDVSDLGEGVRAELESLDD